MKYIKSTGKSEMTEMLKLGITNLAPNPKELRHVGRTNISNHYSFYWNKVTLHLKSKWNFKTWNLKLDLFLMPLGTSQPSNRLIATTYENYFNSSEWSINWLYTFTLIHLTFKFNGANCVVFLFIPISSPILYTFVYCFGSLVRTEADPGL